MWSSKIHQESELPLPHTSNDSSWNASDIEIIHQEEDPNATEIEIIHLEEEDVDEIEGRIDITPPVTPSLPSSLPTSPTTIKSLETELTELHQQYQMLTQKIVGPHKISISGIQHLKNVFNKPWKDKVNLMFYEACVPCQWITDIEPENDTREENPDIVHVYFLNDLIVNKVRVNLEYFLASTYMEKVSMM